MRKIDSCKVEGCGLLCGFHLADQSQICWLHAERRRLVEYRDWRREYDAFSKDFAMKWGAAATKRDNYGLVGA